MLVTLSGMLMLVRELHLENAQSPMLVTLFGMLMLVSELQSEFLQVVLYQRLALITVEKCQRGF